MCHRGDPRLVIHVGGGRAGPWGHLRPPSRIKTGASDGGGSPGDANASGGGSADNNHTPGGSMIRGPPVSTPFLVGSDQEIMERMLAVRCKCVVQLMLQETLGTIHSANFERLAFSHHVAIFDTLRESVDFAAAFNGDHDLRQRLRIGAQGAAPNLLRQEAEGSLVYLKALRQGLMCTLQGEVWDRLRAECETRLLEVCRWTLHTAVESQGSQAREGSELWRFMAFRSPLVVEAITTYAQLPEEIFLRSLPVFYPLITGLVCSEQSEIRSSLSELLTSRITPILNIKPLGS
eukprot:jgi/Mesvir1/21412/Mv20886-RA.1